jgi:predicted DNA-binding transcriptional regulator AlpA
MTNTFTIRTDNLPSVLDDKLLTTDQMAEQLGIHRTTAEAWRSKNIGPDWIKLGTGRRSPVRYRQSAVDKYLASMEARK